MSLTVDARQALDDLAQAIRNERVAIWFGAGASVDSGLPLVQPFVEEVVAATSLSDEHRLLVARVVPVVMPFERFMETLLEAMDVPARADLLGLFRIGEPSLHHRFFAALAHRGWIRTAFTTNFDSHFEHALERDGRRLEEEVAVWSDPEAFEKIDWSDRRLQLVKLHGSVEQPERLGVRISRVADPRTVAAVQKPLRYLLAEGPHEVVLVLGYSFSDRFDVSPAMQAIGRGGRMKRIVHVEHVERDPAVITVGNVLDPGHVLAHTNHVRIEGRTSAIVSALASLLGLSVSPVAAGELWRSALRQFLKDLGERNEGLARVHLAAAFLGMIGADREALPHREEVARLARESGDDRRLLPALQALAGSQMHAGRLEQAFATLGRAEEAARRTEGGVHADFVLGQLGSAYANLARACAGRSLALHEEARVLSTHGGAELREVPHLNGIAAAWMQLGDFDAAQQAFQAAWTIVGQTGDVDRRAEIAGNIASMAYVLRDHESALRWYSEALRLAELSGDPLGRPTHRMNRGNALVKQGKLREALAEYEEARRLFDLVVPEDDWRVQLLSKHEGVVRERLSAIKRAPGDP